jgi:hypothetical protein
MAMNNPGFTVGGRYNILDSLRTHTFLLMLNQFTLKDKNPVTKPFSEYTATIINFNYNLFLTKPALGMSVSLTANTLDTFNGKIKSTGISVGGSRSMIPRSQKYFLSSTSKVEIQQRYHRRFCPAKFMLSAQLTYQGRSTRHDVCEVTGFIECRSFENETVMTMIRNGRICNLGKRYGQALNVVVLFLGAATPGAGYLH